MRCCCKVTKLNLGRSLKIKRYPSESWLWSVGLLAAYDSETNFWQGPPQLIRDHLIPTSFLFVFVLFDGVVRHSWLGMYQLPKLHPLSAPQHQVHQDHQAEDTLTAGSGQKGHQNLGSLARVGLVLLRGLVVLISFFYETLFFGVFCVGVGKMMKTRCFQFTGRLALPKTIFVGMHVGQGSMNMDRVLELLLCKI